MSLPGPGWGLCRATLCSATPTPITTLEWREGWQGGRGKMEIQSHVWKFRTGVLLQTGQGQNHSDLGPVSDLSVAQFPHL